MKHTKRTLISVILACALLAGIAVPAAAADCRGRIVCVNSVLTQLQNAMCWEGGANDWLSRLLAALQKPVRPNTADAPAETPVETPAEDPVDVPVEAPVEVPAEDLVDVPVEAPVEVPAEDLVDVPVEAPVEQPGEPEQAPSSTSGILPQEAEVAELVNQQRAAYGLKPLTISAELCQKARIKSQDMAANRYFSHESPTYGSPFDMMRALGITYRAAGENIAMGYATPQSVMTGWMNSEGHRANILSANFTTIGVGYVANGNYWTQWFIG